MKRYFLCAYDSMYEGLYGMKDYCVEEFEDNTKISEVYEILNEMSRNVIANCGIVEECVDRDDYDTQEKYEAALNEKEDELLDGYILKIKEEFNNISIDELNELLSSLDDDKFAAIYCEDIDEE